MTSRPPLGAPRLYWSPVHREEEKVGREAFCCRGRRCQTLQRCPTTTQREEIPFVKGCVSLSPDENVPCTRLVVFDPAHPFKLEHQTKPTNLTATTESWPALSSAGFAGFTCVSRCHRLSWKTDSFVTQPLLGRGRPGFKTPGTGMLQVPCFCADRVSALGLQCSGCGCWGAPWRRGWVSRARAGGRLGCLLIVCRLPASQPAGARRGGLSLSALFSAGRSSLSFLVEVV